MTQIPSIGTEGVCCLATRGLSPRIEPKPRDNLGSHPALGLAVVGLPYPKRCPANAPFGRELLVRQALGDALAVDILADGLGLDRDRGINTLGALPGIAPFDVNLALANSQQLQRIVLAHAPRQASVSLIFIVRQKKTE